MKLVYVGESSRYYTINKIYKVLSMSSKGDENGWVTTDVGMRDNSQHYIHYWKDEEYFNKCFRNIRLFKLKRILK